MSTERTGADAAPPMLTVDEAWSRKVAGDAVQLLADSEPDGACLEAQDLLQGTDAESYFVVSADTLGKIFACALSDALDDMWQAGYTVPQATPREPSPADPMKSFAVIVGDDGRMRDVNGREMVFVGEPSPAALREADIEWLRDLAEAESRIREREAALRSTGERPVEDAGLRADSEAAWKHFNDRVAGKDRDYGAFTNADWQAACALMREVATLRAALATGERGPETHPDVPRAMHAVVTGCDDMWPELDDEEREGWRRDGQAQ